MENENLQLQVNTIELEKIDRIIGLLEETKNSKIE